MNSSLILSIVTYIYGLAAVCYAVNWLFINKPAGIAGTWVTIIGAAGNIAGIALRWVESERLGYGHAPLSNLYESLVFFAATLAIIYLIVERRYHTRSLGAIAIMIAFLLMAYASFGTVSKIQPLIPALKSNWLIAHVITCFFGYAAFAIAFGVSLMYLFIARSNSDSAKENMISIRLPSKAILDELTYRMVAFGFLFLTVGIITGSVWANSAWGRYWSWDPKETWSLITWFIYATLLHARFARGWGGRRIAFLSIFGFVAVLFTYFGVNFLLSGLHSYA